MAERKQGAMALSCLPLSIDFALLGEEAEQEIRARYFLTGIEDRDDVLEALTGGLSVKTHHWDVVRRDERGQWVNTVGMGEDEVTDGLRREVVAELEGLAERTEADKKPMAGPKDASDFNITDLKHEMAKIMYPRHREFMEHKIAQRVIDKKLKELMPLAETENDKDVIQGLMNQAKEHFYAQRNIEADWAEQIHRELDLSAENPIKELKLDHGPLHPGQLPTIQNGLDFVSQYVDESALGDQVWLYWEKAAPGLTSNFSGNELHLGKSGGISSVIHEMGHWLDSDPAQMQMSIDFLDGRVGDEVPVPMNSVKKDEFAPYANTDFTQPDHFSNPYIGFSYQRYGYNGEKLGRYGTEIMSMGLEMLHSRPWELAQDRGFFKHIMGRIQPNRTFPLVSKSAVKAKRDISHVWRDEMGRWRDTPSAGDDAPKKPKDKGDETSAPKAKKPEAKKPEARSVSGMVNKLKPIVEPRAKLYENAITEHKAARKRWMDALHGTEPITREIDAKLRADLKNTTEAVSTIRQETTAMVHEALDLEAANPVGKIRGFGAGLSGRAKEKITPALDFLGDIVDKDVWNSMKGRFPKFRGSDRKKSYFDTDNGLVYLDPSAGETTIWHEMGHWMESNSPDIMKRSQEFLKRRNAGKDAVNYNQLAESKGRRGHKVFEGRQAYDGGFSDPYTGLIISDKEGNVKATEVLSTGLEMLRARPWELMEDPDHFYYIMSVIQPNRTYTKSASES